MSAPAYPGPVMGPPCPLGREDGCGAEASGSKVARMVTFFQNGRKEGKAMGKKRGWQSALRSRLAVALCLRPGCGEHSAGEGPGGPGRGLAADPGRRLITRSRCFPGQPPVALSLSCSKCHLVEGLVLDLISWPPCPVRPRPFLTGTS